MNRLLNWPARLDAFLAEAHSRPYCLGAWDCAIFAAEGVRALTGELPLNLAGSYRTRRGMLRKLAALGGDFRHAIGAALRAPPAAVRAARRGDVLWRRDAGGVEHIALCAGPYAVAPATQGLARRELADFACAWRVG